MSKDKNVVTPILLKINNEKYIIMNIILSDDGSIYFTFPSKKQNKIKKKAIENYSNKDYEEKTIKMRKCKTCIIDPKISFHPRSLIVHVNSNKSKQKSDDFKIFNVAANENKIGCYLIQTIFPINELIYDKYSKTKYKDFIVLDGDELKKEGYLTLEFIVHSSDIYPEFDILPFSKNRILKSEYSFSGSNTDYTYTVFVSVLPDKNGNSNTDNNILFTINSEKKFCAYIISNSDD